MITACFALPLAAALRYGNPPEVSPPPFRIYTMGDYLFWQASEEGLEYTLKQTGSNVLGVEAELNPLYFPYENGFRLGGGMVFEGNDWQMQVNWTRFYNFFRQADEQNFSGTPSLLALWMHPVVDDYLGWSHAHLGWDLKFDVLDFQLLRVGFANMHFSVVPSMGLKRAWIKQDFHVRYQRAYSSVSGLLSNAFYDVRYKNDFRSIGPSLGLETQLWMIGGLNISAAAEASLLYGELSLHRTDVSSQFASIDLSEKIHRFKPVAKGLIALEWMRTFHNAIRVLFCIGYEVQYWWGQNQLPSFVSSSLPPSEFRANGALTLKGLNLHARFDF